MPTTNSPRPPDYDPDEYYHWEPPSEIWGYRCKPDHWSQHDHGVVDGDTWNLYVDLGYQTYERVSVRAVHVDTAEIWGARSSAEYEAAIEQRDFAREWMIDAVATHGGGPAADEWPLVLRTRGRTGRYGRWLGEVFDVSGHSLERALIEEFDGTEFFRWGDLY